MTDRWQSVDEPTRRPAAQGQPNPRWLNNVETLAHVPRIVREGADWFRSMGTAESPGTTVATVVGDVAAPFVGEIELGTPLWDLIAEAGGGSTTGDRCRAVFSGVANAAITAEHLDAPVSYEGLAAIGSGLGSAGFVVYDDERVAWSRWPASCHGSSTSRAVGSAAAASSAAARSPARST